MSFEKKDLNNILVKVELELVELKKQAVDRLKLEGKSNDKVLKDPKSQFYKNPEEFAMDIFCFYECFKCKKAYFGGLKNC